jgi:Protein of unknown function (DUF3618)
VGTDPEQLKHEIEATRRDLSADVDALTEKVHPKRVAQRQVGRARNTMVNLRERVMGSASDAMSSTGQGISSTVSGAGDAAGSAASAVAETASSTGAAVRRGAQGNPLAAGLIAFGVGWLASSLLPASEQERQAASRVTEVARETAQPLAQQAVSEMTDGMREPAQRAVEQVRSAAGDAAAAVQDQARSSASDVAGEARDAGQRVRKEAGSGG